MAETLPAPWKETSVVGKPLPRIDGYERVSGSAVYAMDVDFKDLLHGVIVRCPHAHARVKRVDTTKAEQMPGVRAVLTAETPGAQLPWYFGQKGPLSSLFDPHCRHEGEEVAAVAAETRQQAEEAARAVVVEYEELPFVIDPALALKDGAPAIHEGGNRVGEPDTYQRGDVAAGFAGAAAVVEMTFHTRCQIHAPLEPHGSVARWDGDELTVWDSTQGVFDIQSSLARYVQLPLNKVRVKSHYMGGGFGSKLELGKYTVIAALLARWTGRPVSVFLSREDTFLAAGNRPANTLTLKAGAQKDGTLTALQLTGLGSSGAYPDGAANGYLVMDLYACPNVKIETTDAFTNAGKARPMRAPGFPQCAFALEQTIDALCEKIGMDPVAFRLKNVSATSPLRGIPFTSSGLSRCLEEGAKAFGWEAARARARGKGPLLRGVGVGACLWGWQGEAVSTAIVRLYADGSVNLNMGASDIGTGTKTVMAMVVAEELGVSVDRIRVEHADTGTTSYAPSSGGSQTVVANAPAVRAAALQVKKQVLEWAAKQLEVPVESLTLADGKVVAAAPAGGQAKSVAIGELKGLQSQQAAVGVGQRHPHPEGKVPLPFAAQFAEVEVDTRTGEVRVLRLLGAHDSGRVMNRLTYQNQVFGGMAMGIGFGMTEGRVLDRNTGKMVNANWHDYKLPTIKDVPAEHVCLPIDPNDTACNTVGAKGLGEPATIPTAAAIANAVYHATGVRVTDTPIGPERMIPLLAGRG
jgi:CO/xanthine dehydrogenase Mo-binding subunit